MNIVKLRLPSTSTLPFLARGRLCMCVVALAALSGCGTTSGPQYRTGYEDSLQRLYVKGEPAEAESRLRQIIATPDQNAKVPPGVYADYGFLLYQRGDYAGAIEHVENEKRAFPESAMMMSRLIQRAEQQRKAAVTVK